MSSRLTKKSLVSVPGLSVKTPCLDLPALAPSTRRPPTSTVISGAVSVSSCARSTSSSSAGIGCLPRNSCGSRRRSARARRRSATSVCSCEASMRPGVKGTFTSWPPFFAACSTAATPPSTIRSASETFLPPVCAALNSFWMPSSFDSTLASSAGWLTSQSFCGARRMRAPLAPPRLSEPRNVEADAQAVETSSETDRPDARIFAFSAAMSCSLDQFVIDRRNRVLPDQLFLRHQRAEIARDAGPCRDASA